MTDFAATHSKPGKSPSETRTKLLEVDTAAKKWEEIMGESIPEQMLKSAYIGIMDSLTRSHLTPYQGKNTSAEDLKTILLDSSPMRFLTAMRCRSVVSSPVKSVVLAAPLNKPGDTMKRQAGRGMKLMPWEITETPGTTKESPGKRWR